MHSRIRHALRERIAEAASRFKTYVTGNVVVLEDDGALVSEPSVHPFDLDGQGLRFTPNSAGGYDVTMTPVQFDTVLGVDLTAGDDTNHRVAFSSVFTFPFFGRNWDHVWVTSNGNVTFGAPGTEGRFNELDFFLELPMIAAFFTDLDPSRIGSVFYRQEPDRFVVTWDGITEFGNFNSNTLQLTLFPDGVFEIAYDGIDTEVPFFDVPILVGVNSGETNPELLPVDLSGGFVAGGTADVLFELFDEVFFREVDIAAAARQFYAVQPDSFDQLVMLTNFDLLNAPFLAFHALVQNDIQGIHIRDFDYSSAFGSAGKLQSFIHMNDIHVWPDLPDKFFLQVLAHEIEHRWSAFVRFDRDGAASDLLRDGIGVHWNYFLDSDGSVLWGNDWADNGDGSFTSLNILNNYSFFDQYLMGLRSAEEVTPFFLIDGSAAASESRSLFPRKHAVANGPKRVISLQDIIAIEGLRAPDRDRSQKHFRQGFLFVTRPGDPPVAEGVATIERLMAAFPDWFSQLTDGRAVIQTALGDRLPVAVLAGVAISATDGSVIGNLQAQMLDVGRIQPIPAGGAYEFHLLADESGQAATSSTLVLRAFPFSPDTTELTLNFGETLRLDSQLQPLPQSTLAGKLHDEAGNPVRAELTLYASSDLTENYTVSAGSVAGGSFAFTDLYVSTPQMVVYDSLVVAPEVPYVRHTVYDLTVGESGAFLDIPLKRADIFLVNDDPQGDFQAFFETAIRNIGLQAHVWQQHEQGVAPVSAIDRFRSPILIWFTGNAAGDSILTQTERDSLAVFLDAGGNLFLTGQNIVESLQSAPFLAERMHVSYVGNTSDAFLHGVRRDPVGDTLPTIKTSDPPGANNQTSRDVMVPVDDLARIAILYDTTFVNSAAAVRVEDSANGSRLVLFGFGLEAVNAGDFPRPGLATREQVLASVLEWLSPGAVTSIAATGSESPIAEFALLPNYPNPFNAGTVIRYQVPASIRSTQVQLEIYNALGQHVRTLVNGERTPGRYEARWDGQDKRGQALSSGVYVYRLRVGEFQQVRKLLLLK